MDIVVVTWCPAEGRCEVAGLMAINYSLFRGISWCCRQNIQTVFLPCLACSSLPEDRDRQEANVSPYPILFSSLRLRELCYLDRRETRRKTQSKRTFSSSVNVNSAQYRQLKTKEARTMTPGSASRTLICIRNLLQNLVEYRF